MTDSETFAAAQTRVLEELRQLGWAIRPAAARLAYPRAEHLDREYFLRFKGPAIYAVVPDSRWGRQELKSVVAHNVRMETADALVPRADTAGARLLERLANLPPEPKADGRNFVSCRACGEVIAIGDAYRISANELREHFDVKGDSFVCNGAWARCAEANLVPKTARRVVIKGVITEVLRERVEAVARAAQNNVDLSGDIDLSEVLRIALEEHVTRQEAKPAGEEAREGGQLVV